jgi:hypothetical protein
VKTLVLLVDLEQFCRTNWGADAYKNNRYYNDAVHETALGAEQEGRAVAAAVRLE